MPPGLYTNPAFNANVSTRMGNGWAQGVCPQIRYNPPSAKHLASKPYQRNLQENFRYNVKENYCGCGSTQNCGKGGQSLTQVNTNNANVNTSNFASGNYNKMVDQLDSQGQQIHANLPVSTMETVNALGEAENVVVYNRIMYGNPSSRGRGQGDPIRGDLPITPCNTGWFQVPANPALDLQQGALNVLAGVHNKTANAQAALINSDVGTTTIGGVNLSTPQLASIGACTDLTVNAFA